MLRDSEIFPLRGNIRVSALLDKELDTRNLKPVRAVNQLAAKLAVRGSHATVLLVRQTLRHLRGII